MLGFDHEPVEPQKLRVGLGALAGRRFDRFLARVEILQERACLAKAGLLTRAKGAHSLQSELGAIIDPFDLKANPRRTALECACLIVTLRQPADVQRESHRSKDRHIRGRPQNLLIPAAGR